jgi:hypothetical protein
MERVANELADVDDALAEWSSQLSHAFFLTQE